MLFYVLIIILIMYLFMFHVRVSFSLLICFEPGSHHRGLIGFTWGSRRVFMARGLWCNCIVVFSRFLCYFILCLKGHITRARSCHGYDMTCDSRLCVGGLGFGRLGVSGCGWECSVWRRICLFLFVRLLDILFYIFMFLRVVFLSRLRAFLEIEIEWRGVVLCCVVYVLSAMMRIYI